MKRTVVAALALTFLLARASFAEPAAPAPPPPIIVDPDGAVHFPAMTVPFSSFDSEAARQAFLAFHGLEIAPGERDIVKIRQASAKLIQTLLDHQLAYYPVHIQTRVIAGVTTDVVTPVDGVAAKNRRRVLLELHSGGFFVGARLAGQLEAAPIANLGRYEVIAVDYRQGPEYRFPAASQDVASVYRALLKRYKAKNIGIYGCSAGGFLVAEATAWFQTQGLPAPGAIGIFCASASGWEGGDSSYLTAPFNRQAAPVRLGDRVGADDAAYFEGVDMKNPLVSPAWSPAILAKFPPTLIITGTRDVAMSAALFTHEQLVKQNVDAELHVWEGLGHGFFLDPTVPESRDAHSVVVKFFDRHLGQ